MTAVAVAAPSTALLWLAGYIGEVPAAALLTISGAIAGGVWALLDANREEVYPGGGQSFLRAAMWALAPALPAAVLTGIGAALLGWLFEKLGVGQIGDNAMLPAVACLAAKIIRQPNDTKRFISWARSVFSGHSK